jgi:hypothetical protein
MGIFVDTLLVRSVVHGLGMRLVLIGKVRALLGGAKHIPGWKPITPER